MNTETLKIDGQDVIVNKGASILDAALEAGIDIPTLCHHKDVTPFGACRLCMVEISQGKKSRLVASCAYPAENGLEVNTKSPKVIKLRKLMIELLLSLVPYLPYVRQLAEEYEVPTSRFKNKTSLCILCGLCVRYCAEVKKSEAVGFIGRGVQRKLAWAPDSTYRDKCAKCFECFRICPTGVFPSNWSMDTVKQLREC